MIAARLSDDARTLGARFHTSPTPWISASTIRVALRADRRDRRLRAHRVIAVFVVIACAATLHATGQSIDNARDVAVGSRATRRPACRGSLRRGPLGAALLAAAVLPLSTAYSLNEALGREAALDDSFREAPAFYLSYGLVVGVGAAIVLIPGLPLIGILFVTQVVNAVLLLPCSSPWSSLVAIPTCWAASETDGVGRPSHARQARSRPSRLSRSRSQPPAEGERRRFTSQ